MTVAVEKTFRKGDDVYCRVLATPYLKELGATQPFAERGDYWLGKRGHYHVFADQSEFRSRIDKSWPDLLLFVFPSARREHSAVIAAGLPERLRFHDLGHTCASILIAQGAHPKEIQARLGHASIMTTMDRYGHPLSCPRRPWRSRAGALL